MSAIGYDEFDDGKGTSPQGDVALPQGEIDELVSSYLDAAVTRRDLRALEARLDRVMDKLRDLELAICVLMPVPDVTAPTD